MGAIADRVRGAMTRREAAPAPAGPEGPRPRNLKTLYMQAWDRFLSCGYPVNAGPAADIRALRAEAHAAGLGEAMEALWIEPEIDAEPAYYAWARDKLAHHRDGAPDPGPRPARPPPLTSFEAWETAWRASCWSLYTACRANDGPAIAVAEEGFFRLRAAIAERTGSLEMSRRCVEAPGSNEADVLDAWWKEAGHRWQFGEHGGFWPLARRLGRLFWTQEELSAQEAAEDHERAHACSDLLLREPWGDRATFDRLRVPEDISAADALDLAERGAALWADPARLPVDDRPAPPDWVEVAAVQMFQTARRRWVVPPDTVRLPLAEAEAAVAAGRAGFRRRRRRRRSRCGCRWCSSSRTRNFPPPMP